MIALISAIKQVVSNIYLPPNCPVCHRLSQATVCLLNQVAVKYFTGRRNPSIEIVLKNNMLVTSSFPFVFTEQFYILATPTILMGLVLVMLYHAKG